MATIKKAQKGAGVPKGYVRGEMSGKLIKESVQKKRTADMAKDLDKGLAARKKAAPKKMKNGGKSFPDLNKDGKVTKADILVGRGVIKAKKGVKVKKAETGAATPAKVSLRTGQLKRLGRLAAKNPARAEKVGSRMVERATRRERGKEFVQKNLPSMMPKSRSGSKTMKKCKYGCK